VDLSEQEFATSFPSLQNNKALYKKLKDSMPDGTGELHIVQKDGTIRFRFNDDTGQVLSLETIAESDDSVHNDTQPEAEVYKCSFKALPTSKANSGKIFIYEAKLNIIRDQSEQEHDFIPVNVNLSELTEILKDRFSVCSEDLMKHLSQVDIGTFQLDISKDGDSYKITRLFQAQAPSMKQERKEGTERELEKLKANKAELIDCNIKLKERVSQLESKMRDYEALQKTDNLYKELLQKLGIKHDNDSKIDDLNLASLREDVRSRIKSKAIGIISRELTYLGFEKEDLSIVKERLEAVITTYVATRASHIEIKALKSLEELSSLQYSAPALYSEYISVVADRILHFFSSPESRKCASSAKVQKIMQDYDLELFSIEPGTEATTKECRFISVRESGFARGACVETVSQGIRKLSTKSVIYKADVIISI
jgi:hypothetical protein